MMSTVKNVHPLYGGMLPLWKMCIDSTSEKLIKDARDLYLPPTAGMRFDGFGKSGTTGEDAYSAYLTRAYYPDVFSDAVETAVGVMHRKEAVITLPEALEPIRERASKSGETLQMLLRRINAMQLTTGRLGILGDINLKVDTTPNPTIAIYSEMSAFNWDDTSAEDDSSGLRFVALDESSNVMDANFVWKWTERSRVLALIDPATNTVAQFDDDGKLPVNAIYGVAELKAADTIQGAIFEPINAQGNNLGSIPFAFINSKDLSSSPDRPPLEGLASLGLAIYRGEADYRQNLFMQGQDTLVKVGGTASEEGDAPMRTGAGACINVPQLGDAKYIGVNGQGLGEQRQSLAKDYERASNKSARLTSAGGDGQQSGDALRIRVAGQTATLPQIAQTGAAGLTQVLKQLAELMGANPDEVSVTPNLEFADVSGNGQTLVQIVQAKTIGAPLSDQSVHKWMVENKFTSLTYEDEIALIATEEPRI